MEKPAVTTLVQSSSETKIKLSVQIEKLGDGKAAVGTGAESATDVVHNPRFGGERGWCTQGVRICQADCPLGKPLSSSALLSDREIPA